MIIYLIRLHVNLNIAFLFIVLIKNLNIAVGNYAETIIHELFIPGYLKHSMHLRLTKCLLGKRLRQAGAELGQAQPKQSKDKLVVNVSTIVILH